MKRLLLISSILTIGLISCQKEIDWGTGANDFADLLVKAVQVTPSTNDTNTIIFQYDNARRLLLYKSTGKVNSQQTDITYAISRQTDGKITKIIAKSSLTAGFLDSTVYVPYYQTGSTKLDYVIDNQYTILGVIKDSTVYTYAGVQIKTKETFTDLFGTYMQTAKQEYTYDASGNVTVIIDSIPDGVGGYDLGATTTCTYNLHKTQATFGEESFIVMGATNASKNSMTKQVVDDASGGASYTTTVSAAQFNTADRPIKYNMSVTPQPPGYDLKLTLYYQ